MNCQGSFGASAMLYAAPEGDPKQCQWEPRPALSAESHNDHNSVRGSDPLLFPATADPVIRSAYCDVIFTAPVSICHTTLAAFIDKPDLFRHRNTGFASSCHNLSSVIVVK